MPSLEHPDITQAMKTGYPNIVAQAEFTDVFGEEILSGDYIIIDEANGGEVILADNLERYLTNYCGFKFTIAD